MNSLRIARVLVLLFGLQFFATSASAVTYCVDDAADLQAKLNLAAGSVDDDEIRLRIGLFAATGGADGFVYVSSNSGDLTISGSWQGSAINPTGCVSQYEGNHSWVDGDANRRALTISMTSATPGVVKIEKLEFSAGTSALGGIGGCVSIVSQGEVVISRNTFYGCVAPLGDGGGLFLQAQSAHIVSNQMFDNAGRRGAALFVEARGGTFYVNNNTLTANVAEGLAGASGGIQFVSSGLNGGSSVVYASNNVFWGNSAGTDRYDIDISGLSASAATLSYNHIGRLKGTPSGLSSNTTSGDPLFVDPAGNDYSLKPASIARNSGNASALGGVGTFDIEGKKRVQGAAVDRGAIEFDELFGNGFD